MKLTMKIGTIFVVIAIFYPVQSFALTEKTCIAYMEIDAISQEKNRAAFEVFDEVQKKAAKEFWDIIRLSDASGWDKWANEHMRKGNSVRFAFKKLSKNNQKSIRHIFDEYNSITKLADETFKNRIDEVEKEKQAAYLKAYKGRRSKVDSVMKKLLDSERHACKLVFGG